MHLSLKLAAPLAFLALPALAQQDAPGSHFILNWDLDQDAVVTLEEATQKREEIFVMFDQDENGFLDNAEYDLFDETRAADMELNGGGRAGHGQGGPMAGVNQGMTREANDADGDGQVTRAEFMDHVPVWFVTMDRDEDGVLTTADFGPRALGQGQNRN